MKLEWSRQGGAESIAADMEIVRFPDWLSGLGNLTIKRGDHLGVELGSYQPPKLDQDDSSHDFVADH